jgi:hypothetical protein
MLTAATILNRFKSRMYPPTYDFLFDVPYETDHDKIESLKFIAELPKPHLLHPFSLVLYPGTKMYEMAKRDGFIGDEEQQIYAKSWTMTASGHLNLLIKLASLGRLPIPLLRVLVSSPVVDILNSSFFRPIFRGIYVTLRAGFQFLKKLKRWGFSGKIQPH